MCRGNPHCQDNNFYCPNLQVEAMGAEHVTCQVREVAVDKEHKIVTGPAYMVGIRISERPSFWEDGLSCD